MPKITERVDKPDLNQVLRLALQNEFVLRCRRNASYSMRAFAKYLELDQSLLSKIMRSERRISTANAERISDRLGLKPLAVKSSASASPKFKPLSDDEFEFLSDWFHFAILELMKTKSFKPEASVIAKRLGIKVDEARAAFERLCRLGMIEADGKHWRLRTTDHTWSNSQKTSEPRRRLQKTLLERSVDAIDSTPFSLRDNGSLTVAVDPKRMKEFKEKLVQVRRELGDFFQERGELSEVYQLTVSFFPLTKIEGKEI